MSDSYDSILILSFGGPEGMNDVMPFLENVVRGKNIPKERLSLVARHYELVGGMSPINAQTRQLAGLLKDELAKHGPAALPVYWGNRNWHPFLADTLIQMKKDGIRNALAFVTSAYSSYSGCRQYLEDIARAQEAAGEGAPRVDKIRCFYNHPLFVETNVDNLLAVLDTIPAERQANLHIAFTAHSIPESMSKCCRYANQLKEICALVAEKSGVRNWQLVYQSRSGPPAIPWLEPDILDHIAKLAGASVNELVIHPIGFVHDHLEVIYDLDHEARGLCNELGMKMHRVSTAATGSKFVEMVRQLVVERVEATSERDFLGTMGAASDNCLPDCCLPGTTQEQFHREVGTTRAEEG